MTQEQQKPAIKPEFIFLFMAIFFGLLFSLVQPLFIEPDSSYHFDTSMYLSNTVVDRSAVGFSGEDFQSTPISFTKVSTMLANGTYFSSFFQTKLPLISKQKADPRISQWYGTEKDPKWYKDIMHLVPAIGVKLGYKIYPSIGSMILTARILNLLFFVLSLFFIIKYAKAYQYIFVAVSLTPTIIQHATSLSYDSYNYIACTFMFMMALNLAVAIKNGKPVSFLSICTHLVFPSVVLYFSKMNSKLLYLMVPAILLHFFFTKRAIKLTKFQTMMATSIFFIIGINLFFLKFSDQAFMIIKKLFYSLIEPYYTVLSTEVISGTSTAAVPYWFYGVQVAMLFFLFFSYNEEVVPKWFSLGSLALVILNFLAVMLFYAADPSFVDHAGRIITGPQGRYFTPFLILLAPVATLFARNLSVKKGAWLTRFVVVVSALALFLNLGSLSVKAYHLHLPADEWRSGIEHYIFK